MKNKTIKNTFKGEEKFTPLYLMESDTDSFNLFTWSSTI